MTGMIVLIDCETGRGIFKKINNHIKCFSFNYDIYAWNVTFLVILKEIEYY